MANNATIAAHNAVQNAEYVDVDHVYKRQVRYTQRNGGGTFTVNGFMNDVPSAGYMVGGIIDSFVFSPDGFDESEIAEMFMKYQARIPQNASGDVYFGTWIDDTTGFWHLDASEWRQDIRAAVHIGRERGELAIWDIADSVDVWMKNPYTGEEDDPRGYPQGLDR